MSHWNLCEPKSHSKPLLNIMLDRINSWIFFYFFIMILCLSYILTSEYMYCVCVALLCLTVYCGDILFCWWSVFIQTTTECYIGRCRWNQYASLELVSHSSQVFIPRSEKFFKICLEIKFYKMGFHIISAKFYVHAI